MKLVSVILINFNGVEDLPACLRSLFLQDHEHIELFLIDNGSVDGSPEALREFAYDPGNQRRFYGDSPLLILNEGNVGFSPALNQGVKASEGEVIVPLNADVVLDSGFISAIVAPLAEPDVGSVTGKLLRFPPGGKDNVIDSVGHQIFRNPVSYTHLRAHETRHDLVCRLLLEKKKKKKKETNKKLIKIHKKKRNNQKKKNN